MSLLRRVRAELTGAWRSVRYDLGRRPVEPPRGGPDVTSTGMNTFGGFEALAPEAGAGSRRAGRKRAGAHARPRRRTLAVTGFGVLTVAGATAAYLGVVNGLGSLLSETPAAADTFPPPPPAVTNTFTTNTGIGQGPVAVRPSVTRTQADAAPPAPEAPGPAATPAVPGVAPEKASPIRTTEPRKTGCPCGFPPVPTPTAPSPATSPSATPSPSSPDSTGESAEPDETSATPSDSADPSESPHYRRRHRPG